MRLTTARKGIGAAFAALLATLMLAPSALATEGDPGEPSGDGIQPIFVEGNPACGDIGYGYGFKVDGSPNGTFTFANDEGPPELELTGGAPPDPNNSVTISNSDGTLFDWAATLGIDAVIVKGGPNADAYVYDPEDTEDTALHAPVNPGSGEYYGISHIEFCYDYELEVDKTAETTYTRDWDWLIAKSNDVLDDPVVLSPGQPYTVNYQVTATENGYTDSEWAVSGEITVENPHPTETATSVVVSDEISGIGPVSVDCPSDEIAPGGTLTCTYSSELPDGSSRTNTATATTTAELIGDGEASADVVFGDPTNKVDECITVTDDRAGVLGEACVDQSPKTFNYSETFTFNAPEDCGDQTVTNTASFDQETGEDRSASSTVNFTVQCDSGCTLTPGYWKTHSEYGPAPYDDNWAQLADGADTPFFGSGQSYYEVLWTPAQGNAYYILARAYIAAELNGLNGADTTDVVEELAAAQALLEAYTPEEVADLKGKARKQWIELAQTLDDYNNGIIGPGHCSEDESSSSE